MTRTTTTTSTETGSKASLQHGAQLSASTSRGQPAARPGACPPTAEPHWPPTRRLTVPSRIPSSLRTSATSVLTRLVIASRCPTREEPQHLPPRQGVKVHRSFGPLLLTTAILAALHLLLPRLPDLFTSTSVAAQNEVLRSLLRLLFGLLLLLTMVVKVKSGVALSFGDRRCPLNERGTVVRFRATTSSNNTRHRSVRPHRTQLTLYRTARCCRGL